MIKKSKIKRYIKQSNKPKVEEPYNYKCTSCGDDLNESCISCGVLCDGYENWKNQISTQRFQCKCGNIDTVTIQKRKNKYYKSS